jgi:hypothetical protein
MSKGAPNAKLRAWRSSEGTRRGYGRGLTMEEAAALVVVDGEPCTKATWHGWESAGKIPKPKWMLALCKLTGLEPNDFYPRPDGGGGSGNGGTIMGARKALAVAAPLLI